MPKVLNIKEKYVDREYVYIGRPSKWGNPFIVGKDGTREEVIQKFAKYLLNDPELPNHLHELKGKNLGCYCAPLACHGDILLRWANDERKQCSDCKLPINGGALPGIDDLMRCLDCYEKHRHSDKRSSI